MRSLPSVTAAPTGGRDDRRRSKHLNDGASLHDHRNRRVARALRAAADEATRMRTAAAVAGGACLVGQQQRDEATAALDRAVRLIRDHREAFGMIATELEVAINEISAGKSSEAVACLAPIAQAARLTVAGGRRTPSEAGYAQGNLVNRGSDSFRSSTWSPGFENIRNRLPRIQVFPKSCFSRLPRQQNDERLAFIDRRGTVAIARSRRLERRVAVLRWARTSEAGHPQVGGKREDDLRSVRAAR